MENFFYWTGVVVSVGTLIIAAIVMTIVAIHWLISGIDWLGDKIKLYPRDSAHGGVIVWDTDREIRIRNIVGFATHRFFFGVHIYGPHPEPKEEK